MLTSLGTGGGTALDATFELSTALAMFVVMLVLRTLDAVLEESGGALPIGKLL